MKRFSIDYVKVPREYQDLNVEDKSIVDYLKKLKNQTILAKNNSALYTGLIRHSPFLIEIAFPDKRRSNAADNKKQLLEMAKNGEVRPSIRTKLGSSLSRYICSSKSCYDKQFTEDIKIAAPAWLSSSAYKKQQLLQMARNGDDMITKQNPLYASLFTYIKPSSSCFDLSFTKELKKLRPDWFNGRGEKEKILSFKRMMKVIPTFVKYKEGQDWKGVKYKYTFICEKYGEFINSPDSLMNKTWKRGLSGHPKMGRGIGGKLKRKKIINLDTNEIFESITSASENYNLSNSTIGKAIKSKTKSGGYNWEYVNEE